ASAAGLEPEADDVLHRRDDGRVAVVEVRLFGEERVQIVLAGGRIERPRRPAEAAYPVVRRSAIGGGITPDVPIALRRRTRRARIHEPRVLMRGVIRNQ